MEKTWTDIFLEIAEVKRQLEEEKEKNALLKQENELLKAKNKKYEEILNKEAKKHENWYTGL